MKLEPNICPVCWAFQDPDTGKCLVCGKTYNILDIEPIPVSGYCGYHADYAIPVIDKDQVGYLILHGYPEIQITTGYSAEARFSIVAKPVYNEDTLFSIITN